MSLWQLPACGLHFIRVSGFQPNREPFDRFTGLFWHGSGTREVGGNALASRPMTLRQIEFDGDLRFFASWSSELVNQIEYNPHVNLAFANPKDFSFLSAQGMAEVTTDEEKAKQLWNPMYKACFPEGLEDPSLCLLKVKIESADYWESPDSALVRFVGFTKSILTGRKANSTMGKHSHLEIN